MNTERFHVGNRLLIANYDRKYLHFKSLTTGRIAKMHVDIFLHWMNHLEQYQKKLRYYTLQCPGGHGTRTKCHICKLSAHTMVFNKNYGSKKHREQLFEVNLFGNCSRGNNFPVFKGGPNMWALTRIASVLREKRKKQVLLRRRRRRASRDARRNVYSQ